MTAWGSAPLGELCRPRQWPIVSKSQMVPEGYPVYGANGLIGYTQSYTHADPTIMIGCRGSCGHVRISPAKAYINGNAMALDALDRQRADLNFLARYLGFRGLQDVTTGTSQPQITRQNLVRVKVPLPPIEEQRRIAAILDQADALRAKRREALALLADLTEAVFAQGFDAFNGGSTPFEDVCLRVTVGVVIKPASHYVKTGVPALRTTNIKPGSIDLSDLVYFSEASNDGLLRKSKLKAGDLVIARTGRPGTTAQVPQTLAGANAIDLIVATPNPERVLPDYLEALMNSPFGARMVAGEQRGQIQQHFNVGSLKRAQIPVPELPIQRRLSEDLARIRQVRFALNSSVKDLDALFQSLQSKAFSGGL